MEKVEVPTKGAVECFVCEKLHLADSEDYISIHGNVCVGSGGGIVGDNFREGKLAHISIICPECLIELIDPYVEE